MRAQASSSSSHLRSLAMQAAVWRRVLTHPYSTVWLGVFGLFEIWPLVPSVFHLSGGSQMQLWRGWERWNIPSLFPSWAGASRLRYPGLCRKCAGCWSSWMCDGTYIEGFKGVRDELVGNWAEVVCQVQPNYVQVFFTSFGCLDLLPDRCRMFHAAREPWDSCLLAAGIDILVCQEVACHSSGQDGEKDFPLHIQQGDASELTEVLGVFFLWNEGSNCFAPRRWDRLSFPSCHHESP